MISTFAQFKWHNPKSSSWVTDYVSDEEENPCIISFNENTEKCTFCMTKKLAEDIYSLLENIINQFRKERGEEEMRIINLGMSCHDNFVCGNFELSIRDAV